MLTNESSGSADWKYVKTSRGENTPGDYWISVTASSGNDAAADSVFVHVMGSQVQQPLPDGLLDGINYIDDRTVTLVLYAPLKEHVFVIGDFNGWTSRSDARMLKDGSRFWITLQNLVPGTEYAYQSLVDGSLTIADPYTEKVLDPWNDQWIAEETYPGLKPYPSAFTSGITGIFQTGQPEYAWNDFEGNESWGYNPSFYFAPDKYYGPAKDLKAFIDSCHSRGVAVIIDMVLNHSFGQSPLVQCGFTKSSFFIWI